VIPIKGPTGNEKDQDSRASKKKKCKKGKEFNTNENRKSSKEEERAKRKEGKRDDARSPEDPPSKYQKVKGQGAI